MPRPVVGFEREQETAMTLWKGADELGRLINTIQSMAYDRWNATLGKSNEDAADTVVIDGVKVMRALKTIALALDRTIAVRADEAKPSMLTHFIAVWQEHVKSGQWVVSRDRLDMLNQSQVYEKFPSRELAFNLAAKLGREQGLPAFWYDEHRVSRPITSTKG